MALKWADGNGGRKDVLSLPTASTDVKGGIKVGQNLYMAAESLNASPMGGVSFSDGLHFDNGTLTFDPLEGLPIGDGLYFDNGTLNALPLGGVSFGGGLSFSNGQLTFDPEHLTFDPVKGLSLGDGLYFDNGALTFNPLTGLPIGDGLYFDNGTLKAAPIGDGLYYDNGTLKAAPAAYWCASMADFPEMPQAGCIAIADNKPYFFDGSDWLPFCPCSPGGDSGSPDPPDPVIEPETYIAPQFSTRTIPCTLTLHYDAIKDQSSAWNWGYQGDGWTVIVLPEYVTSRNQITITGANGEIIEPLTPEEVEAKATEEGISDAEDRFAYENSFIYWYDPPDSYLTLVDSPTGDLATQLRWNTWWNDGNRHSMQINISFNVEARNIIAGKNSSYSGELYCVDDCGNDFYKILTDSSVGTAINAQGAAYRDDGSGIVYFDGRPASVVLDEFDPENNWGLGGLSVNWNDYIGATVLRIDLAGETPEVIRTQHFTDAASHSSAMIVDLPFTNAITLDECGLYSWEQVDNNNDSRYNPTIENGVLRLYADNGISLIGEIALGGQDFTIDGIYMACQVSSRPQRIFSMQTAIDKQNGTYTIALVVNQGQMGVHMEFAGSSNTNGTSSGTVRQYWHHFAIVYQHEKSKAALYIDGVQVETATVTLPATGLSFDIGNSPSIFYNSDAIGWYSHFRVFRGVAVWTDSFTIDVNTVDSMIGGVWRYVNAGDGADMLTTVTALDVDKTKSLTGKAFYGSTSQTANFSVPATPEVWFKFDLFFNSAAAKDDRFSFGHYSSALGGYVGIWNNLSTPAKFLCDAKPRTAINTGLTGTLGTINHVALHMVSSAANGLIELTVNGATYTYTGNVNNGADFDCLYVYSSTEKILFSNIIISSGQIGFSENLY